MKHLSLEQWRERFVAKNACPWPGPRPLLDAVGRVPRESVEFREAERAEAARQLRGRALEVADLGMACMSNHLVVVHGQSGVGKSSLINVGLVPELQSHKKTVILRKDWGISGSPSPSEFVTQLAVNDGTLPKDPFADGPDGVDREFPNQLVFILDQFEELIRSDPTFAHEILRWIEDVAGKTSAKFVISLRSEYEYQLRDLHTKPFTKRVRVEVRPIDDLEVIATIIGGDRRADVEDIMPIADDAKEMLVTLWSAAQSDPRSTAWNRPGLLHLQATLYVLWMARRVRVGGPSRIGLITLDDVKDLVDEFGARQQRDEAERRTDADASVFGFGLERSVEAAIRNCLEACNADDEQWEGVPRVVKDQTRWIFRDITAHLASGGYKTQQDMWELACKVLSYLDEPALRKTPEWALKLHEDRDWLGATHDTHGVSSEVSEFRSAFSSGPAAALTTDQLMFELYRCYFFALEWMSQANLVQILPAGASHRVTLTHDRFSEGLASWRGSQQPDFREAVGRYVAHRGKADLAWADLTPGLSRDHIVANVRWRQCRIADTMFSQVTFVNCDFAGSTFEGCEFDGAVFVNCVLDDTKFVGCSISAAPQWTTANEKWEELDSELRRPLLEDPPTFTMDIESEFADDLTALLPSGPLSYSRLLQSPPSGSAIASVLPADAVPTDLDDAPGRVRPELPSKRGGLVMCGGRLSSLSFRRCEFQEGSRVALRHIAGTSLEIGDQTHGAFDIFAAAIRGLVVTRPVSPSAEAAAGTGPGSDVFEFDVRHAKVINTWLGVDLVGEASFHDCNVWQLLNASENMKVAVSNCAFVGLINVGEVTDPESLPLGIRDFTEAGLSPMAVDSIRQVSQNIDV